MKKGLYYSVITKSISLCSFLLLLFFSINNALAQNTNDKLVDLLKKTQQNLLTQAYEMKFILANNYGIKSYKLQHVFYKNEQFNKITSLDGIANMIIQQDNLISYLSPNNSYSIKSEYISDYIPPIFMSDIDKISKHYIFVDLGYERINGIKAHSINIASKIGFKYQYNLLIDKENKNLLQANLLDQNGILLEQFKVVDIKPLNKIDDFIKSIIQLNIPQLIENSAESGNFKWQANWIPDGFNKIKNYSYQVDSGIIESSIYSDGLFSFTIYVAPKILKNNSENYYNNGKINIYSQTRDDFEMTIIGQIPLQLEKNIIEELTLNQTNK